MHSSLADYISNFLSGGVASDLDNVAKNLLSKHKISLSDEVAILGYGSSLRMSDEQRDSYSMADFFFLLSDLRAFHRSFFGFAFNRLLPPSVYFYDDVSSNRLFDAKYNVASLSGIVPWITPHSTPFFWARLSQPCRLKFFRGSVFFRNNLVSILCKSHRTAFILGLQMSGVDSLEKLDNDSMIKLWKSVFYYTYSCEIRTEKPEKAFEIVDHWREYYIDVSNLLLKELLKENFSIADKSSHVNLGFLRFKTKLLYICRLIKAGFTTNNNLEYLLWKIERHSKQKIELKPWQERLPGIRFVIKFYKLYRKKTFR